MNRKIKDIGMLCFLCVLLCGCRDTIKKQSSDWREDKIAVSESYGSDWSSTAAENEKYIFYLTQDGTIMRFDKEKQQKKRVIRIERQEDDPFTSLGVTEDKLYYLTENVLYQSDFDGRDRKIICSREDIKNPPDDCVSWIYAVYIENNDIYLMLQGNVIGRLDKDKREINVITATEDVNSESCFYKGGLFYRNKYGFTIYRQDLQTLKTQVVRGQELSQKDSEISERCRQIFMIGDQLYYICDQEGEKAKLYQYSENGEDEVKFEDDMPGDILQGIVTDSLQKIYVYYYSDSDNTCRLRSIDLDTGKTEEEGVLNNFDCEGLVIDGNYLYVSRDNRNVYSVLHLK